MAIEGSIIERLAKLEALFAGGATIGERAAAGEARDRLLARLAQEGLGADDDLEVELRYSLPDEWAVRIFIALCRKHGNKPYRYSRQRYTTVMVRVHQRSFERTVGEEFGVLVRETRRYFDAMVDHLIADAMKSNGDDSDLDQRLLPG
jgi:hypothetical protein